MNARGIRDEIGGGMNSYSLANNWRGGREWLNRTESGRVGLSSGRYNAIAKGKTRKG